MDVSTTDADSPRALLRKRDLDYRIQLHANSPEQREPEKRSRAEQGGPDAFLVEESIDDLFYSDSTSGHGMDHSIDDSEEPLEPRSPSEEVETLQPDDGASTPALSAQDQVFDETHNFDLDEKSASVATSTSISGHDSGKNFRLETAFEPGLMKPTSPDMELSTASDSLLVPSNTRVIVRRPAEELSGHEMHLVARTGTLAAYHPTTLTPFVPHTTWPALRLRIPHLLLLGKLVRATKLLRSLIEPERDSERALDLLVGVPTDDVNMGPIKEWRHHALTNCGTDEMEVEEEQTTSPLTTIMPELSDRI
ncbi:hypothetical protein DYB32_010675 [Aphanomyces invadans]|uniref:Uncharacterized protein n=1 Tax=Aphanomyces invadans TaxID=157072 RepID=A0A3R6XZL9_9STRA|nr:hypothetical protein DYB32_010675 [Aphanomyces invadans]